MPKPIRPIRIEGNDAFVTLTRGKIAIIDLADVHLIDHCNWHFSGGGYAETNVRQADGTFKMAKMHRVLMKTPPDMEVDHINGNCIDNRRGSNLRNCTHAQNMANVRIRKDNTSGFKGVYPNKGKWKAQIRVDGQAIYLGTYATPAEAYAVYLAAAEKHFGEFARAA